MQELDDTIEEFLAGFYEETIRTMTRETFEEHVCTGSLLSSIYQEYV